jgi:hypothetical protein
MKNLQSMGKTWKQKTASESQNMHGINNDSILSRQAQRTQNITQNNSLLEMYDHPDKG